MKNKSIFAIFAAMPLLIVLIRSVGLTEDLNIGMIYATADARSVQTISIESRTKGEYDIWAMSRPGDGLYHKTILLKLARTSSDVISAEAAGECGKILITRDSAGAPLIHVQSERGQFVMGITNASDVHRVVSGLRSVAGGRDSNKFGKHVFPLQLLC